MTSSSYSDGVSKLALVLVAVLLISGCARRLETPEVRASVGRRAPTTAQGPAVLHGRSSRLTLTALRLGRPFDVVAVGTSLASPLSAVEGGPAKLETPIVGSTRVMLESNALLDAGKDGESGYVGVLRTPATTSIARCWNLIHWPTLPIMFTPGYVPGLPSDSGEPPESDDPDGFSDTYGIGDLGYMGFFSPNREGAVTWGIGPAISVPTASDPVLGTGKWSASGAFLFAKAFHWGGSSVIARQLLSVAGDEGRGDVNQLMIRPALQYKLKRGWYLISSPTILSNFPAKPEQRWVLPVGLGVGRVMKWGCQPVNLTLAVYHNTIRPTDAARWQVRFTFGLIFPRK